MANEEHVAMLKQGSKAWNEWRAQNWHTKPELRTAHLNGWDLWGSDLSDADLWGSNLHRCNLSECNLRGANLQGCVLVFADIRRSTLWNTDLREVFLNGADLSIANLRGADLTEARVFNTIFGSVDLSEVKGLDTVIHQGVSTLGIDTLQMSRGQIPDSFLRGCGLSDADIEYAKLARPGLSNAEISDITYRLHHLKATQAIQISPLFISYSSKDSGFVDALEGHLNTKGIRFWRDVHDAVAGRLETQIDQAIRSNPTFLLILSQCSVESDWVEHEVRKARELEKELKRDVICPIALDAAWNDCRWPERLREQIMEYNILDFSKWQNEGFFSRQFNKLIEGLHIFYRDEKPKE